MIIPVSDSEHASGSPSAGREAAADPAPAVEPGRPEVDPGPPDERCEWARLDPDAKRERLLLAATDVFARDGLDAPMSEVAGAAGAGVASLYRLFASKHELLAALVTRRMTELTAAAEAARAQDVDRWTALTGLLASLVANQRADYLMGEAQVMVADHPDVIESATAAAEALERLLAEARTEGRLRADASAVDLRLLFAATRAARNVAPEHWPRMLELMIDALDAHRSARG
ncbi:MAG TPA: TetR/AcrR family transcriptional regulator [Solirubrobacteraceae bacterium]